MSWMNQNSARSLNGSANRSGKMAAPPSRPGMSFDGGAPSIARSNQRPSTARPSTTRPSTAAPSERVPGSIKASINLILR